MPFGFCDSGQCEPVCVLLCSLYVDKTCKKNLFHQKMMVDTVITVRDRTQMMIIFSAF